MAENLSITLQSSSIFEVQDGNDTSSAIDPGDENALIESISLELGGRVDREQIWRVVQEVKAKYLDATVDTFIPIFVRREVIERLK